MKEFHNHKRPSSTDTATSSTKVQYNAHGSPPSSFNKSNLIKCYNLCRKVWKDSDPEIKKMLKNNLIELSNCVSRITPKSPYDESLLEGFMNLALILDPTHRLLEDLAQYNEFFDM